MRDFGLNLRKLRELRGFSPEQMADALGQSVRTYLKNESGEREMTRIELKDAAEKLEVPAALILALGEHSIFDFLNKNPDLQLPNATQEPLTDMSKNLELKISYLEGRLAALEKVLLQLTKHV